MKSFLVDYMVNIQDIKQKAATGKPLIKSLDKKHYPHFEGLTIVPAQLGKRPVDEYKEDCNTSITLGSRYAKNPLKLSTPILIGAMSYGALSPEVKAALAQASAIVGTATNSGEGGLLPKERENAKTLIVQWSSGRWGVSASYLRLADAIEIKIGQGAKPGMGGMLLGPKVTAEVAAVRKIPIGSAALSPAAHLDMFNKKDLGNHVEMLREITDFKVPIIIKLAAGNPQDVVTAAEFADIVAVDGAQGGTGAAPLVALEESGIPTIAAIASYVRALEEAGLREKVDLIVSGGINDGADVAKALALGADAVYVGRAILVAIGCIMCNLCYTNTCPVGITTQDPKLRKKLMPNAAQAAANFIKATNEELKILAKLSGHKDIAELSKDDLRALDINTSLITDVKLIGQDKTARELLRITK